MDDYVWHTCTKTKKQTSFLVSCLLEMSWYLHFRNFLNAVQNYIILRFYQGKNNNFLHLTNVNLFIYTYEYKEKLFIVNYSRYEKSMKEGKVYIIDMST